jgi:hypothetical protein
VPFGLCKLLIIRSFADSIPSAHSQIPTLQRCEVKIQWWITSDSVKSMRGPRWSPDGRYILASKAKLPWDQWLYDFGTKKWTFLISGESLTSFPSWSHDSEYIYYGSTAGANGLGNSEGIIRVNVQTKLIEPVISLDGVKWTTFHLRTTGWFGLTPDDRIIILRDRGSEDVYAFDIEMN